jgi:hypothetical protein
VKWADVGEKLREPLFAILSKVLLKLRQRTPKSIGLSTFGACNVEMVVTTIVFGSSAFGCGANCKEAHLRCLPNRR